jgi:cysteinyl-tRNA synthetase
MKVFNTMSRQAEELVPLEEGHVRMYTCGPTVYDYAHVGNYRAYVFEDLLRRTIKYAGFRVTQVMNLTDVDDKTITRSREQGKALDAFTQPFKDAFFEDLKTLNIEPAEHYPAATDHIGEMIALIQTLFDKGYAYRSEDGSVYFSIARFEDYGKLAHLDRDGLQAGARVTQDEYEKENVADFALWKAWTEGDGDVAWDSPWGRGRPGWHIECSAMSSKYLGESFDIHTGGVDNIFPHHEDEIAQSEAASGKTFVRYWMHCAHLKVEGQKMAKSLGNCFKLFELHEEGYSGREIRYLLISAQYRQTLNFTFGALNAVRVALGRLDDFTTRMRGLAGETTAGTLPDWAVRAQQAFDNAIYDDLNAPEALAALFELLHAGNRAADAGELGAEGASAVVGLLARLDSVLGVLEPEKAETPPEVLAKLEQRQVARTERNWAESDRIRDALGEMGWEVRDTPDGQIVKKK